ncbi:hypothetical protein [Kitasatospora indigofera]
MSCPKCHIAMWVNGRFWQCSGCGYLIPYNGYVPVFSTWSATW